MSLDKLTTNGTYKILKEFGFPVLVAIGLFLLVMRQQKQLIAVTERSHTVIENNTAALTRLEAVVNVTVRGNYQRGKIDGN